MIHYNNWISDYSSVVKSIGLSKKVPYCTLEPVWANVQFWIVHHQKARHFKCLHVWIWSTRVQHFSSFIIIMITIILVPPEPIITYESFTAFDPNNATIIITLTVSFTEYKYNWVLFELLHNVNNSSMSYYICESIRSLSLLYEWNTHPPCTGHIYLLYSVIVSYCQLVHVEFSLVWVTNIVL